MANTPVPHILFALMLLQLCSSFALAESFYTMEDLQVLEKEHSYKEFFLHARDIRPSLRGEKWREMTQNMAQGLAKKLLAKTPITLEEYKIVEDLSFWPQLKFDEIFLGYRARIGVQYLTSCFAMETQKQKCFNEMHKFWFKDKTDKESAKMLAILFLEHKSSYLPRALDAKYDEWLFIDVLIKGKFSVFYCDKSPVRERLSIKANSVIKSNLDPNWLELEISNAFSSECWKIAAQSMKIQLKSSDVVKRKWAYKALKATNNIAKLEEDIFLLQFVLDGPTPGDLYNLGWNTLTRLRDNYQERTHLVELLKKIDPLPDATFSHFDKKTRKVLTKKIAGSLPEYLNYYANTCIDYLRGSRPFPKGNPTINCQAFFQVAKKEHLISPILTKKYQNSLNN
jgi:hypothetical protein